jgi:hypothetical protein
VPEASFYELNLYRDGSRIRSTMTSAFVSDGRASYPLSNYISDSGSYTFSVQAFDGQWLPIDLISAQSPSYLYQLPAETLPAPTGRAWELAFDDDLLPSVCFDNVPGAGGYEVELLRDGDVCVSYMITLVNPPSGADRLSFPFLFDMDVEGRYTFRVRAWSADIEMIAHSLWSAESPVYQLVLDEANSVLITVAAGEGGTASGAGRYRLGSSVSLIAYPASGYAFDGWYENDVKVSDGQGYWFTAAADRTLEARFVVKDRPAAPQNLSWSDASPGLAQWDAVPGASSYIVELFKDGLLLDSI